VTETRADDFATIHTRVEDLRRERERAEAGQTDLRSDPPMRPRRRIYWPEVQLGGGPNQGRRSGPISSSVERDLVGFGVVVNRF
jgi:hypothetical protein